MCLNDGAKHCLVRVVNKRGLTICQASSLDALEDACLEIVRGDRGPFLRFLALKDKKNACLISRLAMEDRKKTAWQKPKRVKATYP